MIQIKSNRLLNSFKSFLIKFTTNLWKRNFYFCFLSFDSFFYIWQINLRGRDFFSFFSIKGIIKKGAPRKKSLSLKITCHVKIFKIFILNQNTMFYMSFDSSNQDESKVIIFMNRALNIILSVKIFSIFGKY